MKWKIISIGVSIAATALSMLADKANEEKMKKHIREEVEAQLSERDQKEEESE